MTDAIPTQIGKYQIVELVGEGAMGTVYRAVDSVIGRTVAIKVMNPSIARQKDHRQRFLREAQAAGSFQHPNVVTIYDMGEVDGHLFIAMEFVDGEDLDKLMALSEPLKLQSKLDIIVDVLIGLSYAHKHGVVHRDIKPANIRVGEDGSAKVMDFGVARLESSDITRTGLVVGTPSYMAPEQVMGGKAVPGTDLFAVGAVLYHLLTGSKPFEGPSLQSLFYRIVTDMPRPIGEIKPGLPPALDRITQKAMAKDPAERYANALDMANEIISVRAELSGNAYPTTSASLTGPAVSGAGANERMPRGAKQRRIKPLAAAGVAAAAAAAAIFAVWLAFSDGSRDGITVARGAGGDSAPANPASYETPFATAPINHAPDTQAREMPPPAPALVEAPTAVPRPLVPRSAATKKTRPRSAEPAPQPRVAVIAPTQKKLPSTEPQARITAPDPQPILVQPPVRVPEVRTTAVPTPAPAVREDVPAAVPAPRELVASVVAAYARAIESRDIDAVRRAYPGLTSGQSSGFQQFFQGSRSINVTFRVAGLETNGNTADARLVGSYEYVTTSGKSERQSVSFDATLRYDGSAWRLTSVR